MRPAAVAGNEAGSVGWPDAPVTQAHLIVRQIAWMDRLIGLKTAVSRSVGTIAYVIQIDAILGGRDDLESR